jgi:hypothetical protein
MRRFQEAEKDFDWALSIQKRLAAGLRNVPDLRNEPAGTYVNLVLLHSQQGGFTAAKRLLLEGRPHHLAALKADPRHPAYRQFYGNHLNLLTTFQTRLLQPQDAVRITNTCQDLGWNAPADAYAAAGFLSRYIRVVANHPKLDDRQRKEAAQFYGDAAMKLLRDAVSKGFKDVDEMKSDTDLAPLSQREDLQKLIAELQGKAK